MLIQLTIVIFLAVLGEAEQNGGKETQMEVGRW